MGIAETATVEDVINTHGQIRHRVSGLNQVEDEIDKRRQTRVKVEDIQIWRQNENKYSNKFSYKNTWQQIR